MYPLSDTGKGDKYMNELYHHGVLGQKWGVRRYQNKDGSLTAEGKKRVGAKSGNMSDEELASYVKRKNLEKQYAKLSKESEGPSKAEKTKKVIDTTSNLVNQAKKMNRESIDRTKTKEKLDLSKMTDKELRDRINRANLERQYNDLFAKESVSVSKGQAFASNLLEAGGSALAIGSSALGIALAIKDLRR